MSVSRHRCVAGFAIAALLPALVVAGSASALPKSHASKIIFERSLSLEHDSVKTSTGVKLGFEVSAEAIPGAGEIDNANVSLSTPTFIEAHSWEFLIGAKAFTATSKGAARLNTASKAEPYGAISLSFTPKGASKRIDVCNADNYTLVQPEKVKGSISFDTRSTGAHAWGKVRFTNRSLRSALAALSTTYQSTTPCRPTQHLAACSSSVTWEVTGASATTNTIFGSEPGSGRSADLLVDRMVLLAQPKNAARTDFVLAKEPAPKLTTSGSSATVTVTTSGPVIQGSGTLKSSAPGKKASVPCKGGTQTYTTWTASFIPGASALRASEQIFGTIGIPATTTAQIVQSQS
jgi:hypothetical protein